MVRHVNHEDPAAGTALGTTDPLLRVIHRVAHREHLHRTIRPTQFTRRRPVAGVQRSAQHAVAGTTARKVTWS